MHGYALAKHIKQSSAQVLRIEEGSLYPALQRMLKEGWVQAEWVLSATNRRVRLYRLTKSEAKHLLCHLHLVASIPGGRVPHWCKPTSSIDKEC